MKNKYDTIVIGSGPGGSTVANTCAEKGLKVAVADELFGGTCALRGCTPKKAMESVTSIFRKYQHLRGSGIPDIPMKIDWQKLQAHKQLFTADVVSGTKENFQEKGIDLIESAVKFTGKNKIKTKNGTVYQADNIVIATGATPRPLDFPGNTYVTTTRELFELNELPSRILFAGGGYIGFEMAQILAATGSEIVVASREEMPLQAFDTDLVSQIIEATLSYGIQVKTGWTVSKIEQKKGAYRVTLERLSTGEKQTIETDLVIHSAGRVPNVEGLNLKKGKVDFSKNGIKVDKHFQSISNKNVYAIGDVIGNFPFTPIANFEGEVAANNIINKTQKTVNYDGIPMVMFTYPKLAAVGMTEAKIKEKGLEYDAFQKKMYRSLLEQSVKNPFAGYKVMVEKKTGKILGAHLLGGSADETINLFAMAIQLDIRADKIKNLLLAYPTAGHLTKYMVGK
jgi:glutathione reductase (NADPH)